MVYEDGDWKLKDRDQVLEQLIEDRTCRLEEWLDEQGDECDEMRDKFEEYVLRRNNDHDVVTKRLKSEIQRDLYNIRKMVKKN